MHAAPRVRVLASSHLTPILSSLLPQRGGGGEKRPKATKAHLGEENKFYYDEKVP